MFALDMISAVIVAVCNLFYPKIAQSIIAEFETGNNNIDLVIKSSVLLLAVYAVKAILNWRIKLPIKV